LVEWYGRIEAQEQSLSLAHSYLAAATFIDGDRYRRVKDVYRRLARFLHPDASPENADLFEKYWPSVQTAYRSADGDLLDAILHTIEFALAQRGERPASADADESGRLRLLVASQSERLACLKRQAPHCYAEQLVDDRWLASKRAELATAIEHASEQLARQVAHLAELLARSGVKREAMP
jgi:hypothetical protein